MNLIPVIYKIKVGKRKFFKKILVKHLPLGGSYLNICNFSFVVESVEQDLDVYFKEDHKNGTPCEAVIASLAEGCCFENDYNRIINCINEKGWEE